MGSLWEMHWPDSLSADETAAESKGVQSARQTLREIAARIEHSAHPDPKQRRSRAKRKSGLPTEALLKLLDASITPMIVLDQRGNSVYCNTAFRNFAITGLSESSPKSGPRRAFRDAAPEAKAWLDSTPPCDLQDIQVLAQPFGAGKVALTAFSIIDNREVNRKQLLWRSFLHDLMNTAAGIQSSAELLKGRVPHDERREYFRLLQISLTQLFNRIRHERATVAASGPRPSTYTAREILDTLMQHYRVCPSSPECRIEVIEGGLDSINVVVDNTLLVMVLGNMLRNAIEATSEGGLVTLGCRHLEGEFEFWVHNQGAMPENVRLKVFNQAFSTKDSGRGTGMQGITLLSEVYLGGKASFTSDENGTTFSVRVPAAAATSTTVQLEQAAKNVS